MHRTLTFRRWATGYAPAANLLKVYYQQFFWQQFFWQRPYELTDE
jgi:hypothetical protein